MLRSWVVYHPLHFTFDAGTSRGVLRTKDSYFVWIAHEDAVGVGEISFIPGLSPDFTDHSAHLIATYAKNVARYSMPQSFEEIQTLLDEVIDEEHPAMRFGFETALLDLLNGGQQHVFESPFAYGAKGIKINGLIWMGEPDFMLAQIDKKLNDGFTCLKMKIGAISYERELEILKNIRAHFPAQQLTLRVDANGAFGMQQAVSVLEDLHRLDIHSIEQPIKAGNMNEMAQLCAQTPVPIALDEELIGVGSYLERLELLEKIRPQYIILKPSLVGGFGVCDEWISLAEDEKVGWWMTSALESNVGLNAIAQYTAYKKVSMPQGLGTGQLFSNNVPSPLEIRGEYLFTNRSKSWDFESIHE